LKPAQKDTKKMPKQKNLSRKHQMEEAAKWAAGRDKGFKPVFFIPSPEIIPFSWERRKGTAPGLAETGSDLGNHKNVEATNCLRFKSLARGWPP